MNFRLLHSFVALSFICAASAGMAQEAAEQQATPATDGPPQLQPVFSDDFSTDTRGDYEFEGEVAWEPGRLTLSQGASITREINGGAWAQVELTFDGADWASGENAAELQIWFLLEGATNCAVRFRKGMVAGEGHHAVVSLLDTEDEDGQIIMQPVREGPMPDDSGRQITVKYRNGFVEVRANKKMILTAYIENGAATVAGCRVQAAGRLRRLAGFAAECLPALATLTEEQQQQFEEAVEANSELIKLHGQGQFAEAAMVGERVLRIRQSVLGKGHPDYAESVNNLAVIYQKLNDYARAKTLHEEAMAVRKMVLGEQHPDYAQSLNNLAVLLMDAGDYAGAERLYQEATEIRRSVLGEQHPDFAASLNTLASLYVKKGDYVLAEPLFQQALEIRKSVLGEQHPAYAISLDRLASFYVTTGEYDQAEQLYKRAVEVRKSTVGEQHPDYAESLNNLAVLYLYRSDFLRAESLFKQASLIWKDSLGERHLKYAMSLHNLAGLYETIGDSARAEPLLRRATEKFKLVLGEHHPAYAQSLNNLATLYSHSGEYVRAERLFLQGLEIRRMAVGDQHADFAQSLNGLALLYDQMGDPGRAKALVKQALEIRGAVLGEHHPAYAESLNNLAAMYENSGDYSLALPLHRKALEIRRSVLGDRHPEYAESVCNLAGLYVSMKDFTSAEQLYKEAIDIRNASLGNQHPDYVTSLNNLAFLYWRAGNFAQAKSLFSEAAITTKQVLGEQHPSFASILNNLALVNYCMGDSVGAKDLAMEAHAVLLSAAGQTLPGLSTSQAIQWTAAKRPRTDLCLATLRDQAQWMSPDAYRLVWSTKHLISRLRPGQQMSDQPSAEARQVFEQLHLARLKLAQLVTATPNPDQAEPYRKSLSALSKEKEQLEQKLAAVNPASRRQLAIRDASVEDLQRSLPRGVAVIDFARLKELVPADESQVRNDRGGTSAPRTRRAVTMEPVYDAFVLRKDRQPDDDTLAAWVPLGPAAPIDDAIADWRRQLTAGTAPSESRTILRRLIWDRLESQLDGIHTVVVIADGALHRLPWLALPGRASNTFLIDDFAVVTATSGQQLFGVLTAPVNDHPGGLLLVGGVQYDERPLSTVTPTKSDDAVMVFPESRTLELSEKARVWEFLNGTATESDAIALLWNDRGPTNRLTGREASEERFTELIPRARYVHVATHGFFDTSTDVYQVDLRKQSLFQAATEAAQDGDSVAARNPLLMTGLVMAGANIPADKDDLGLPTGADGILTAEEIAGISLRNTELVTLSACETGLGEIAVGQGVFGIQRALHGAGARSVIASLWKVDDRATQELMRRFYTNLWEHDMSKIDALREAQLWLLRHPKELEAMGVKGAATRGDVRPLKPADENPRDKTSGRTDPFFWAAFQLSGDWR